MALNLMKRLSKMTEATQGPNLLQAAVLLKLKGSSISDKIKFLRSQGFKEPDLVKAINIATGTPSQQEGIEEGKLSQLLASGAIAASLLTAPISDAFGADLNDVSKVWDIVTTLTSTMRNTSQQNNPRPNDVSDVLAAVKYPNKQVDKDSSPNKGRAGRYDAPDGSEMTCAMREDDLGKYFLVKNTRANKEIVVKCTDVDKDGYSSDKIIKLSNAAFIRLGGSDHDVVLDDVIVSELKQ